MAYSKAAEVRYRFLVDIRTGILKQGDRVDSIRVLCARYRTCIATMTKVLAQLKAEGFLEVSQGRATRIRKHPGKRITLFYCDKMEIGDSPFWSAFYRGICKVLDPLPDYTLTLCNTGTESDNTLLDFLKEGDSGFLVVGELAQQFYFQKQFSKLRREQKVPYVVLFPESPKDKDVSVVMNDFTPACLEIVEALKAGGARNPLLIGEHEWNTEEYKFTSFLDVWRKVFGKTFKKESYLQVKHTNLHCVYAHVMQRLESPDPPDSFLMMSDAFAPAVIRACHDSGKMLPLCGCDNLDIASMTIPSLTSIELSREEIGRKGAELLLEQIRNPQSIRPKKIIIPAYPVFRESLKKIEQTTDQ